MNQREILADAYGPGILEDVSFLEPDYFDNAIVGLAQNESMMMLAYSEPRIIHLLMKHENMTEEQAIEHFNMVVWEADDVLFVDDGMLL